MRKVYRTIDDVLRSPWGAVRQADEKAAAIDRVTLTWIRSNRRPRKSWPPSPP